MESFNIMDLLAERNKEKCAGIGLLEFDANNQLPEDEKTLRKYGLKDNKGEYTAIAMELVIQKLVRENKEYLLELVAKKEVEDKGEKVDIKIN